MHTEILEDLVKKAEQSLEPNHELRNRKLQKLVDNEAETEEEKPDGIVYDIFDSIFTPGLPPRVQAVLHLVFFLLVLNFVFMLWLTDFNGHVLFLTVVSMLMWITVTWFIANLPPPEEPIKQN
ncbi:hypothetical protein EDD86DRAFT_204220 [Gorgonomyces haynaldii]|nr:hypothetical protein EDD86DRAFT_204220 [Gorgonomyces haynaldii]